MILDDQSYGRILDSLHDGLYFVDRERKIIYWNRAAERISGFASADVLGRCCSDNILTHVDGEGRSLCHGLCPLAMSLEDGKQREAEVFLHHKDGARVPVSVRISPLVDQYGAICGAAELFTDISNYKSNELRVQELEKLALLDTLTGIANRRFIERELTARIEEKKRGGISCGVLMIDIDHFKIFNDTYGHDVGDLVLKVVSQTFVRNCRPFDVFGRWGGEEFIGILRNVGREDLDLLGNRLRTLVESSYMTVENERLHVTISIGATIIQEEDSLESILKRVDTFLYESKRSGRNRLTSG